MRLAFLLSSILGWSFLNAQTEGEHSALKPTERLNQGWWKERFTATNKKAQTKQYDLLFIGDSINQGWEGAGKEIWQKYYGNRNALNLGFSGDRTQHVIWRLQNGNLTNQENAKVAIIMIGTNNTGHTEQDPRETAEGVSKIVSLVREGCPKAKILLLGIFPRAVKPTDKKRLLNEVVNKRISKLHDGQSIHYLELDEVFLDEKGILTQKVMPDALHPKKYGYQLWAESMEPKLKDLGL